MKKTLLMLAGLPLCTAAQQWTTLFDGKNLNHWHSYNKTEVSGWQIAEGVLSTDGKKGNLCTNSEYENFDLRFEFKVSEKGNSGVIYKVIEQSSLNEPYLSGPEFQIIDDVNYPQKITDLQKTGANYDMNVPNDLSIVKPAGQWNKGRILIRNNYVEHWLNGKKVVAYQYGSEEWKTALAKSKFAKWEYAKPHNKGKICLQGHGDTVWFKKIRIKQL